MPGIAYFIVTRRRMLAASPSSLPHAEAVDGPAIEDVWRGFEQAFLTRCEELAAGEVKAACVAAEGQDPPDQSKLVGDKLVLAPPCQYCEFQGLCGERCS